jgi:hypothetical protein
MKKISLFLISFLFIYNSYAITGNVILPICEDSIKFENNNGMVTNYYSGTSQITNDGVCIGYVAAVADAGAGSLFCPPPNSTYGQDMRIFVKYLNNHPEKLNLQADELVYQSLKEVYECPSTPPPAPTKK